MLTKAHLTLHAKMSGSRWVATPSSLSGSWRSFLYSSSVYSCHLFYASVRSIPFLSFWAHLCMKCSLGICNDAWVMLDRSDRMWSTNNLDVTKIKKKKNQNNKFNLIWQKEMATHSSTLAWKFHGQRSLVGYSPWGCKESHTTAWLHKCLIEANLAFAASTKESNVYVSALFLQNMVIKHTE